MRKLKVLEFAERKGMEKGLEEGMKKGLEEGMKKGLEEGMKKGIEEGIEKGIEEGQIKVIKQILTRKFGPLPHSLSQAIDTLDLVTRDCIINDILDMQSIEDLRRYIPDW